MTVSRLENEMTGEELDEWVEFYNLEPFGNEERMFDKRNALKCSISANSMGGEAKATDFEMYRDKNIDKNEEPINQSDKLAQIMKIITTT